ncbi:MAG: hypothetical protein Q9220_000248 [cf. Caloplaca sp. 1 TL-2023]
MATTPPPRNTVHTPPTPLHGAKYDTYRPSSSRKSTRQTTRHSQRAACTPPPAPTSLLNGSQNATIIYSPPPSTHTSPQTRATKRRKGNSDDSTSAATSDSLLFGGVNMDESLPAEDAGLPEQSTLHLGPNMLPTPAKTPRKQDLRKAAELQSAARVLFPSRLEKVEDAMPSGKGRRGRKHVGFSLDSSGEDEKSADQIPIFTDSKEKVPELDLGEDNPFIERPQMTGASEPQKTSGRRGRKRQVKANPHIEEAFNREEGMVYVFRGKKIFRRFTPDPDQPDLSSEETEIEDPSPPRLRPLTRASVKPRLLFPTEKQRQERQLAEEEALTDIEDPRHADTGKVVTPVKESFGPATPPTTGHATRSTTRRAADQNGSSPLDAPELNGKGVDEHRPRKKTSPFDGWQRTKATSSGHGQGTKRGVEYLEKAQGGVGNKKVKIGSDT